MDINVVLTVIEEIYVENRDSPYCHKEFLSTGSVEILHSC